MLPVLVSTSVCERSGESSPSCSSLARPSVIRSVLNPEIPLSEGRVSRRLDPVRPNYQDQDLLDVLGHCFTDPLFQSLLRFPDGTEMSEDQVRTSRKYFNTVKLSTNENTGYIWSRLTRFSALAGPS